MVIRPPEKREGIETAMDYSYHTSVLSVKAGSKYLFADPVIPGYTRSV